MYTIRLPSGDFLDLPRGFQLSFELNNQVFSSSNIGELPGAFTFPAQLPLSTRNKTLLGNPQLLTNARRWQTIDGVQILCYGVKIFQGTLTIRECGPNIVTIAVIAQVAAALKGKKVAELDLGGERFIGLDEDARREHMKDTAVSPNDYDYVFFPVVNRNFRPLPGSPDNPDYFQNFYKESTGTFLADSSAGVMPFVRVDYLLQQLFSETEFEFYNRWQIEPELIRLYLYNNYDIREVNSTGTAIEFPTVVSLRNHVPDIEALGLLKQCMAAFCLGLFTNIFEKTVHLVPLRTLLRRPPARDWSAHVLADYTLQHDSADAPLKFCWEKRYESNLDVPDDIPLQSFNTAGDFYLAVDLGLPVGKYYLDTEEVVVEVVERLTPFGMDTLGVILGAKRKRIRFGDSPAIEIGLSPLKTSFFYPGLGGVSSLFPVALQEGRYVTATDSGTFSRQGPNTEASLMLYRGIQATEPGGGSDTLVPYASNDIYTPLVGYAPPAQIIEDGSGASLGDAKYSLLWHKPQGLYQQWWQPWHQMLKDGKQVTMQFALPLDNLTEFNFQDKIRVHNMDYFAKKLKIGNAIGNGRIVVEANLVSVI